MWTLIPVSYTHLDVYKRQLSYRSIVIIKLENIGYLGFYFYEIVVPQAKETALSMAADGMKAEKIAHYLKVSAAMVQNWIDESMSVVQ